MKPFFFGSGRGDVRNFAPGPWGFTKALKVPQVFLTVFSAVCVDDPRKKGEAVFGPVRFSFHRSPRSPELRLSICMVQITAIRLGPRLVEKNVVV